ncbi:hypothetical protein SUGI_0720950 [Cryptomeria japonica]|uniref:putative lipid-transfer protein DIR1 n=1 Tax=Cryptomeria japonica TaxID=3369 RepID=UPI0024149CC2|nr:putative lipid-transfer protein DIR1 [Cryptomeria japonica]GLJ35931.1 hypothetical protein SUGI_0720950 [Cryptomeria japonica]
MKYIQVVMLVMAATLLGSSAFFPRAEGGMFDVCNMGIDKLMLCQPAVTNPPSDPTSQCCDVVKTADLKCLCSKQSMLPKSVDPKLVTTLPQKCKVYKVPAECKALPGRSL